MKHSVLIGMAAILLAAGCTKEISSPSGPATTTIVVSLDNVKTTLSGLEDGSRKILWAKGDQIKCNGVLSNALEEVAAGKTSASFTFEGLLSAPYVITYPADYFDGEGNLALPESPATVQNGVFPLKSDTGSASVSLQAVSSMVKVGILRSSAGDADTDIIKFVDVTANGKTVRVNLNIATSTSEAIEAFVPVPAGESTISVKVVDVQGHYMVKATSAAKTLVNGQIMSLPAFAFVPTATQVDVEINSADEWNAFASQYNEAPSSNNKFVKITADLDFTDKDATVLGNYGSSKYFSGCIDGDGHKISNLNSTHELVAAINSDGALVNLTIDETCSFDVSYTLGTQKHFGPFVEYVKGCVKNCVNKAPITLKAGSDANDNPLYIGGVVGRIREGVVDGCSNEGAISLQSSYTSDTDKFLYVGGICGWVSNADGSIKNCTNSGAVSNAAVSPSVYIGGVAGKNSGTIDACSNSALINSTTVRASDDPCKFIYHGGIVGDAAGGKIQNCSNSGNLTSSQTVKQFYAGGVAATVSVATAFTGNTSSGDITTTAGLRNVYAGGLFGQIKSENTINLTGTPFTGKILINTHESSTAVYLYAGGIAGIAATTVSLLGDACSINCDITMPLSANAAGRVSFGGILGGSGDNGSAVAQAKTPVTISGFTTSGKVKITGSGQKAAYNVTNLGGILGGSLSSVNISNCSSSADVCFADAATTSNSNGKPAQLGGIVGSVNPGETDDASTISNCSASGGVYSYLYNNNVVWPSAAWTACNVGGIIGSYGYKETNNVAITISNCSVTGTKYSYRGSTGGLAGFVSKATITDCSFTNGSISRGGPAGGLVAVAVNSAISGCTVKINAVPSKKAGSTLADAGGVVALAENTSVDGCKSFTTVSSDDANRFVGGIIGNPDAYCTIGATTACSFGGSVAGTAITNSNYSTFAVGNANMTPAGIAYWDGN